MSWEELFLNFCAINFFLQGTHVPWIVQHFKFTENRKGKPVFSVLASQIPQCSRTWWRGTSQTSSLWSSSVDGSTWHSQALSQVSCMPASLPVPILCAPWWLLCFRDLTSQLRVSYGNWQHSLSETYYCVVILWFLIWTDSKFKMWMLL